MLSSWAVGHIPSKGKRSQIAETVFLHKQFLTSSSKGSWCCGVWWCMFKKLIADCAFVKDWRGNEESNCCSGFLWERVLCSILDVSWCSCLPTSFSSRDAQIVSCDFLSSRVCTVIQKPRDFVWSIAWHMRNHQATLSVAHLAQAFCRPFAQISGKDVFDILGV